MDTARVVAWGERFPKVQKSGLTDLLGDILDVSDHDFDLLCTDAAKEPAMLKWADGRACSQIIPEIISRDWGIDTFGWGEM